MTYYPEQGRVHVVIIAKGPKEKLNPEETCHTKCGKELSFKNIVKDDDALDSLPKCRVCLDASRNMLALPPGFRKVYLREE